MPVAEVIRPPFGQEAAGSWIEIFRALTSPEIEMPSAMRLVGLALLRHGGSSLECFPSFSRLAECTGLGRVSVWRAIKRLEECGWVVASRSPGRGSRYVLRVGSGFTGKPVSQGNQFHRETTPVHLGNKTGFTGEPEVVQEVVQEVVHIPAPQKKARTPKVTDPRVSELIRWWHDEYQRTQRLKPVVRGGAAGKAAKALVSALGLDDAKAVVTSFLEEPPEWHRERGLLNLEAIPGQANAMMQRLRERRSQESEDSAYQRAVRAVKARRSLDDSGGGHE